MNLRLAWGIITAVAVVALGLVIRNSSNLFQDSINLSLNTSKAATAHDYYNQLITRSDLLAHYSLRDPKQLQTRANGGYAFCNSCPLDVTYTYPNDPDPRQQDAAKVVVPSGSNNLRNQVRVPIPTHAPQSLFITWDGWFGKEWNYSIGGIPDQKTWQFGSPFNDIHLETRNRYQQGSNSTTNSIAKVDGRLYPEGGYSQGPNVTFADTLAPQVGTFILKAETLTRWFAYLQSPAAGDGTWYEYSLWVADVNTPPVKIFDKLKVRPSPQSLTASWESFWLEFNTSTSTVKAGRPALVAYVRNVVALKGTTYNTALTLLQQPGATGTLPPPPPPPPADTTPPTVSISSPANGATVSGTITISASASDNVGVSSVEFRRGTSIISTDVSSPYTASLNTTTLTNGTYSLTAIARDAAGNSTTSTAVSITVNNVTTPPPPPPSTLLPGDLNGDKIVNSIDWSIMNSKWLTSDPVADINKDGLVNSIDFSIMNSNWLQTSP